MRVIGFNFSKVSAERLRTSINQLNIDSKMNIISIESLKSSTFNTGEDILGIEFTYTLKYEPDFAKIELAGNLVFSIEPKLATEVLKEWESKNLPEDFKIFLFNAILKKSNLKALELEDDLGLPPHLPLPSVKKGENQEKKED
jgi:hypothetical protein